VNVPKISIIIPAYNSESQIKRCIRSITSQTYPREKYEIIVVDDGSTDNTVAAAKASGADLVITSEHYSQSHARNIGVKHSNGKILAFIDSDCEAKDGWLETIEKEIVHNEVIGGPLLNGYNNSYISWAEYLMEFSNFSEHKKRGFVNFIPGGNQVFTKTAFLRTDGFSEVLKVYETGKLPELSLSEDVFICNSLRKKGIQILFVPELQVYHYGRKNIAKYLLNMDRFGRRTYRNDLITPSIYSKLMKAKWSVPLVFIVKLGARARSSFRVKKFSMFLVTLPLIVLGTIIFCKGVWKEIGHDEK